ncbi:MAG TPA: LysM domain-containing protein [Candidatus Sabulitectum sp.]|nr:LysM domain-containing protein [Candidatus Sabulitectum sp.]HPJ28127.1 LysM domain-containing protein [Candidatus Sabulitectum sp.]HPR22105.1 LysM domain-containing protein [Candidatus Sabulitectum sp.]
MKNALFLMMAFLSAASMAGVYEVGYGDTLWDISTWFYGTPEKWTDILAANPDLRGAEYLIPGMVLEIPNVSTGYGDPGFSSYTTEIPQGAVVIRSSEPILSRLQREGAGYVSYSPLSPLGHVLETNAEEEGVYRHDIALPGDIVELDIGAGEGIEEGRVFHILRPGETVKDPETGASGTIIRVAGVCRVTHTTPSTSIALVEHSYLPARAGDAVVPYQAAGDIYVNNGPSDHHGSVWVLGFRDPDRSTGYTYDVVYLSAGDQQGIQPGDVFTAYSAGEQVRDTDQEWVATAELPIADLVVLTVEERSCAAMIVSSRTPNLIETGDRLFLTRSQTD